MDLILNNSHEPSYDEINDYISEPARVLWQDMNLFLQHKFGTQYRICYSKCSGKPGWNVKYQKSGKSLCTLYPEKESYIALVVVSLNLVSVIKAMSDQFNPVIMEVVDSAKPFNGTLWLMIRVDNGIVNDNVKQLLLLKYGTNNAK